MKQLRLLNPEQVSDTEAAGYPKRAAARAIVVDHDHHIALLYVAKEQYYKLPGGGLEGHEDQTLALRRECREEVGVEIDILGEVGSIIEYRKFQTLTQTSYCYLARVKGEKGAPTYTDEEQADAFQLRWVPFSKAISLLGQTVTTSLEGKCYITPRDETFLTTAAAQFPSVLL